ncbi:hypothetical protein PCASD_26030 [Puccinia coronata f. sp. avenae]|uniref:Uncharacterized protein n=1 Tax=Puccinia coronata f. sp. avenae TaxID=200324 RepID=A0A2N5RZ42_9BASI|nr:hypothetical protein PCASD_26030 [Puccinia coronata f. sp. avenae]
MYSVQTPARPPLHAARRPHAYKWREDSRLGVRPRRTGVLAMHACPEGVQALNALRTGVHGRHACPARLTGTVGYPYEGTVWYPYKGTTWYPYKGTKRYPYKGTVGYPYKGTVGYPYKGTVWYSYKGTVWYPYKGTKRYPYKGLREPGWTGVHGQHACPAGPHAKPAVLTPFVGVRTACGMRGFARLVGKA